MHKLTKPEDINRIFNFKEDIIIDPSFKPYTKEDFLREAYITQDKYNTIINRLKKKNNIILQGAPGVGKSFLAKKLAYSILGYEDNEKVQMIQFHQSYSYEDFIMGYRPNDIGGFDIVKGVFYKFCKKAIDNPSEKYYFSIDEINRGNDYALRRRFSFIDIEPAFGENFKKYTKFYPEAMQKNYLSINKSFISSNLYQIFAYVKNSKFEGKVSGMLLYPTVDYEFCENYKLSGNDIYMRTLDLSKDFSFIKIRLHEITTLIV